MPNSEEDQKVYDQIQNLTAETVINISGLVQEREEKKKGEKKKGVEISIKSLNFVNLSEPLPFPLDSAEVFYFYIFYIYIYIFLYLFISMLNLKN